MNDNDSLKGQTIVLASHNQGKLKEFQALFAPYDITVISASELGLPEPEETGTSFEENAALKAEAAATASGKIALADDSGLCVSALDGDPGIYSARWAGPEKDFKKAMDLINQKLGSTGDRSASFVAVLALATPDGHVAFFEGTIDGVLALVPSGTNGFGYDPLFMPEGEERTFGDMSQEEKMQYNHRRKAFDLLAETLLAD